MAGVRSLVVGTEIVIAESIRRTLARLGYSAPATALSGEEAIARAQAIRRHRMLIDIHGGEQHGEAQRHKDDTHDDREDERRMTRGPR